MHRLHEEIISSIALPLDMNWNALKRTETQGKHDVTYISISNKGELHVDS